MTSVVTYNTLVADKGTEGSIKSWVDHDSIPAPLVVTQAEQFMWRRLRVREQITTSSGTISQGDDTLSLPSDYVAPRLLQLTNPDPGPLEHRLPEEVEQHRLYDGNGDLTEGRPHWFYADGSDFVFTVKMKQAYDYRLLYFHQPAPLSSSSPTNFLTDRAFRGFLGALLSFSYEWLNEPDKMDRWLQVANAEVVALNAESDFAMGRNLHMTAYAE